MSNLSKVMDELSADTADETVNTTVQETVQEPAPEPVEEPKADPVDDSDGTPAEPQARKDLSTVSKQEKAEYAFRRQLSKMKDKHGAELKERDDAIAELRKEVEALKQASQPAPETKTRMDFKTDEEYINWYMDQKMDGRFSDRDKAEAKAREEAEAKAREQREVAQAQAEEAATFRRNIDASIPQEQRASFEKKLSLAVKNGLGEVLDNAPMVRDYIFQQADGPALLSRLLDDRDSFVKVFSQRDPMSSLLAAHDIVRGLHEPAAPAAEPVSRLPSVGKPGAGGGSPAPDMFSDDSALLKFIRQPRRRR